MKKLFSLIVCSLVVLIAVAQTKVTIDNPEEWTTSELSQYRGQTITFTTPFYVCNNYSGLVISPRRTFSPTNQELPGSQAYEALLLANNTGEITLTNVSDYHRLGERIENLTVYVSSTSSVQAVGTPNFVGNTRADLEKGYPSVDMVGDHTLLVCAFNLEYYLVENLGTGYGPDNAQQSAKQHTKIMDALTHIKADIFGFVEIEQGQTALRKLADAMTTATGKRYSFVNDGGSSSGSYTKSGYIYCSETVEPYGEIRNNNVGVVNRKKMQAFKEKATGESFIFSLNHFKAKSGKGSGDNKDQGDGQGSYNATRIKEAESVLSQYQSNKSYYKEDDILIMGDLNAYGKEDPIITLLEGGMTDLHRYFHADSSYSYVFRGEAGYLDHALANETMLTQITGMQAYHINSDESDKYTYDKSNDQTMFRSSDHDPILVGLSLGKEVEAQIPDASFEHCELIHQNGHLIIRSAKNGYYRIYDTMGNLVVTDKILYEETRIDTPTQKGIYIIQVFIENRVKTFKIFR